MKKLLTVHEAAGPDWLDCNPKTVYNMTKKPGFPALRIGEKKIRIPSDLLLDWIVKQAAEPLE